MITKTLKSVDDDDAALTGVTYYIDANDQQLENPVERKKGSELKVRAEKDGYNPQVQTVTFVTDGEVTFTLTEDNPDEVTITYSIRDKGGELIGNSELLVADTLASNGAEGSITIAYGKREIELCGQAVWHEASCQTLVPDRNRDLTIRLERETVEISITPDIIGYTDQLVDEEGNTSIAINNTEYRLTIGDSTWIDNLENHDNFVEFEFNPYIREGATTTFTIPAGPEPLTVSMRAVYVPKEGKGFNDSHWLQVAEGTTELTADSDSEVVLELAHIPACRDGVDNTFDGRMDANAPGCLDTEVSTSIEPGSDGFVYEPDDDVELLRSHVRSSFIYGDKDYSVSGASGERFSNFITLQRALPEAFRIAIEVKTRFTKLVSTAQDGEEFALKYHTGPEKGNFTSVHVSEIVLDEGADGWTEVALPLSREYYPDGTYHGVEFIHATEIRGEAFTDGDDRVVIFEKGREDGIVFSAIYEPEELPTEASPMPAKTVYRVGDVEITDTVVELK